MADKITMDDNKVKRKHNVDRVEGINRRKSLVSCRHFYVVAKDTDISDEESGTDIHEWYASLYREEIDAKAEELNLGKYGKRYKTWRDRRRRRKRRRRG